MGSFCGFLATVLKKLDSAHIIWLRLVIRDGFVLRSVLIKLNQPFAGGNRRIEKIVQDTEEFGFVWYLHCVIRDRSAFRRNGFVFALSPPSEKMYRFHRDNLASFGNFDSVLSFRSRGMTLGSTGEKVASSRSPSLPALLARVLEPVSPASRSCRRARDCATVRTSLALV